MLSKGSHGFNGDCDLDARVIERGACGDFPSLMIERPRGYLKLSFL